ncbi:torsin-1A-interacting protein 2-like [Thalassophryne amazonica]|uniref:torsin-1A-interacting protein 2-like n=1 Tax=Thalassophryne amazonica TaxID=390379 RepID=UPI001471182A|nr:torsin-1A-interacting protein 2-like [Thalassophryne amazonica]
MHLRGLCERRSLLRLQRLREHHDKCERRFNMSNINQREQKKTLQLLQANMDQSKDAEDLKAKSSNDQPSLSPLASSEDLSELSSDSGSGEEYHPPPPSSSSLSPSASGDELLPEKSARHKVKETHKRGSEGTGPGASRSLTGSHAQVEAHDDKQEPHSTGVTRHDDDDDDEERGEPGHQSEPSDGEDALSLLRAAGRKPSGKRRTNKISDVQVVISDADLLKQTANAAEGRGNTCFQPGGGENSLLKQSNCGAPQTAARPSCLRFGCVVSSESLGAQTGARQELWEDDQDVDLGGRMIDSLQSRNKQTPASSEV